MKILKKIKKRKLKRKLERGYEVLKKGELNYLEYCELLLKMKDLYEKLYPETIELQKKEDMIFDEWDERCNDLEKMGLKQCEKYFPRYLNQVESFINSAKCCVLEENYRGIRDLNKMLLKMMDIIEKEVFNIVAFRDIREIPIFADWFVEYALSELHEKAREIRSQKNVLMN